MAGGKYDKLAGKTRPGTYINFESDRNDTVGNSERGIVLLPLLHGWGFTVSLFTSGTGWLLPVIAIAAFFATLSYLCYYRAIAAIGASKSMALNVTYAAWAIFFTAVFLGDTSVLTPTTIICALIVIVCGILTAADGKDLFSKNKA